MAESKAIARQVGARIRQLRTERGMSLEKLALECGMNPAFLGHVERGMRCPTIYTLARVCTGLDISLAELFVDQTQQTENAAAIQHVTDRMRPLSAGQAKLIAQLVDDALALLSL